MANSPLGVIEWIALIGLVSAGLGAVFNWIHQRLNVLEGEMKELAKIHAAHEVQLERLKTNGENTAATLAEIKETQVKMSEKLDAMLLAIQK